MNLLLFTADDIARPLPPGDARAIHLLEVLRRRPGDSFDAGLVNGPRGRGTLVSIATGHLELAFTWGEPPPPADPVTLIIALPRPQTARDILRDATTLGVASMHFVATQKSDANYARSTLWDSGEWRRHLLTGAAQAFDTRVPAVTHGVPLADTLAALPAGCNRIALDNYEAAAPLATCFASGNSPLFLAFGPERGWGPADRALLRSHGFTLAHLGTRVLRLETAVVAALTLAKSARGSL